MLYGFYPSHFIRPQSKASLVARWTWVLHSWWAAHIKWQPWYLGTDGAARLNSDVCFSATVDTVMILGGRAPEIFILQLFGNSLSQSSIKSSAYRANLCAELPVGCWSYSHFLSIFGDRLELYVIVIGLIHRPGLTWDLLLLSTDEDKHQWWCVVHLIYCSWFNLIKCAVWLSGFQVKGIIHRGAVCYESQHHVICNRLWLRIAENAFSEIKGIALLFLITSADKDQVMAWTEWI